MIYNLLREGEFQFLIKGILKRIKSTQRAFGMKRDLTIPIRPVRSLKKIRIEVAKPEHHIHFEMDHQNFGIVKHNIPNCYVAVTEDGVPCFRQWLISSSQNEKIREFWGDSYPELAANEALIENAFTLPKYRGFGVMPHAMDLVAQKAEEFGAQFVLTFSPEDNVNSIKACHYAGFRPYIMRTENWFLFRKKVTFSDLPDDMIEFFKKITLSR